jgi:proteasome lid subunit RPN8/RPN11
VQAAVRAKKEILDEILRHAFRDSSLECCGLLGGREGTITCAFETANAAGDPRRSYEIAPEEIFKAIREMRSAGLQLLGIYHSHPAGENRPSTRDIELAYYPETPYFILSPLPEAKKSIRAFLIRDGGVTELEIQTL